MQDNPQTWLGFTDLVMIDPVGTGWSRPAKSDGGSAFYSVRSDAQSLAKAVALYLAKNGRAKSPKYILGESYGGFRAAKVAQTLQREQGIALSGIVMVSPLIEGSLIFGGTRFALGAALQLPSLAAAELERKGTFSKEAQAQAERFALTDYLTTLAGAPPKGDAARDFYARVAQISGLPEQHRDADRAASSATPTSSICARPRARSSAATTRPSRSPIRSRSRRPRAAPIRCSTALSAAMAARSRTMPATSSASRPR